MHLFLFFSSPSFKLVVRFVVVALQAARVFIENRSRREPGDEGKCSRYQLALAAGIRERADDGDTTSRRRAASQCPKDIKRKRETPSTRNLKGKRKKRRKKGLRFKVKETSPRSTAFRFYGWRLTNYYGVPPLSGVLAGFYCECVYLRACVRERERVLHTYSHETYAHTQKKRETKAQDMLHLELWRMSEELFPRGAKG